MLRRISNIKQKNLDPRSTDLLDHLPLIYDMVENPSKYGFYYLVNEDDFFSEAVLEVFKQWANYNPEKGRAAPFIVRRVKNAALRLTRRNNGIKYDNTVDSKKVLNNIGNIKNEIRELESSIDSKSRNLESLALEFECDINELELMMRESNIKELAKYLVLSKYEIPLETYEKTLDIFKSHDDINTPINSQAGFSLIDILKNESDTPYDIVSDMYRESLLKTVLEVPFIKFVRESKVRDIDIFMRGFFKSEVNDGKEIPYQELADEYGISRQRVYQIIDAMKNKLRKYVEVEIKPFGGIKKILSEY